jgi:hypothetical protein
MRDRAMKSGHLRFSAVVFVGLFAGLAAQEYPPAFPRPNATKLVETDASRSGTSSGPRVSPRPCIDTSTTRWEPTIRRADASLQALMAQNDRR